MSRFDRKRSRAFVLALLAAASTGCGGAVDDEAGTAIGPSGFRSDKKLADFDAADAARYCDWMYGPTGELGPFDKAFKCADGTLRGNPSRSACIAAFESVPDRCSATVGSSEACVLALRGDICNLHDDLPVECRQPRECQSG